MKPLRIDFLPPRRPPRRAWQACALVAVLAVAAGCVAVGQWREVDRLRTERARLQMQWNELRQRPSLVPSVQAPPYDADARMILRQASFPAAAVLTALEGVAIVGVTPSSVELSAESRSARVLVDYADQGSLMNFLAALNAGEDAPRWALVQARNGGATGKGSATFQAQW